MLRRKTLFVVLLTAVVCLSAVSSRPDTYPRSSSVDARHYRISITLSDSADTILGETEISFELLSDDVKVIELDLDGLTVDGVKENDSPAQYTRAGSRLNTDLSGRYHKGDSVRLTIAYHGKPADGLYLRKNKFGDFAVFADNWPNRAHYWFPSIDHPYDKATAEFFVTAPERFDVVANGALVERASKQNGTRLTHWSETVPIPVYCMVIGAAEFSVLNANVLTGHKSVTPVMYYLYPKDREAGIRGFGRAPQMVDFYDEIVGPYPYEKLALVESSTRFGGMENSSNIFFDEKSISLGRRIEDTVAHEIAHQWFGDSVTESDWHHLWLSEGFATYFGHLFFERADGEATLRQLMRADKAQYLQAYSRDPKPVYDPRITNLFELLNPNNYQKGGWVLHMLRHVIGDDKFFAGIRDYYRTYRDRNALTADLQRAMEAQAGKSLDWFFKEWIFQPGYPVFDVTWTWNDGSRELAVRVVQTQTADPFQMPLELEIESSGHPRREILQVKDRDEVFKLNLDSKPSRIAIDPDEWVLKSLTIKEAG